MNCCDKNTLATRRARLFWCATVALVALFVIIQFHEVIPFLHHDAEDHLPGDYCPFCIIKVMLTFAVSFYFTACIHKSVRAKLLPPAHIFTPVPATIFVSYRGPPILPITF